MNIAYINKLNSLFLVGVAGFVGSAAYIKSELSNANKEKKMFNANFGKDAYKMSFKDNADFPFTYKNEDEWNYRKVEMMGSFLNGRFLVRDTKNGVKGYKIFAPFSTNLIKDCENNNDSPIRKEGIFVEIGFMPSEKWRDLKEDTLNVSPIDFEEIGEELKFKEYHTNFMIGSFEDEVLEEAPLYKIKGVLRKGEDNYFKLLENRPDLKYWKHVDLLNIGSYFHFDNIPKYSNYYVQLLTEEASEEDFPIVPTSDEISSKGFDSKKITVMGLLNGTCALLCLKILTKI